jgi:hypothetical protein
MQKSPHPLPDSVSLVGTLFSERIIKLQVCRFYSSRPREQMEYHFPIGIILLTYYILLV